MIDSEEHFYDDDPSIGHPDVRTRLKDIAYFFLGNGLIQAAVQISPSGEGTPVGLLIMNPEILAKKRESLTMDPESGLGDTMLRIMVGESIHFPAPGTLEARWIENQKVPYVHVKWKGSVFLVEEFFRCSKLSEPVLVREVRVKNLRDDGISCRIKTGFQGDFVEEEIDLKTGSEKKLFFQYSLGEQGKRLRLDCRLKGDDEPEVIRYWEKTADVSFDSPILNRYFHAARSQLPAAISKSGRVDGSIWQYNREWVRDQAMMTVGLTLTGHNHLAKVILQRLITEFVTEDGDTIDSSEKRHPEEVELDQNGVLLHALKQYVLWTGDHQIVNDNWEKLRVIANFPLKSAFCHPQSGLLANTREYWERHRAFGIQKGMELAHQLFVSVGLSDAAALARSVGREKEGIFWESESERLKQACLFDEKFGLVEDGQLFKRRSHDGSVQDSIQASDEAQLPEGVPLSKRGAHLLNPDTSTALPIALGFIPADSTIAKKTMASLESLWGQAWEGGGYGRYHVSSEPDSPGPWPFPSLFVARAYAEMQEKEKEKVWEILNWLNTIPGAISGAWFEFYGERLAPPFPQVGVTPWTWAEMIILLVHHIIGIRPQFDHLLICPKLLPGMKQIKASFPLRNSLLFIEIHRKLHQDAVHVRSNCKVLKMSKNEVSIAYSKNQMNALIMIPES
ncbi:MAG: hypothetical protein JSV17_15530 [Candidatus Aminicenantes bacterium]|nr:MAG: hypothetical protein JSV17_15530 [Candidatus Aminicenantes bacterium]